MTPFFSALRGPFVLALSMVSWQSMAGHASRESFGKLPDGTVIEAVTLTNDHGARARIISYGAALQSLEVPDRHGERDDVVLAYPKLDDYLSKPQYFGAIVGRFANRIAKGQFTLDDKNYQVPTNDGPNALHGGSQGFDKRAWTVNAVASKPEPSVTLQLLSKDGDQGFPGTLTATVTYTLTNAGELRIAYAATTDKPTIVNFSNHTYWNLSGEGSGSVLSDILTIPADTFTPVDATLIPTGEFRSVAGTDFDFRAGKPIGQDIRDGSETQLLRGHGYDLNWVVSHQAVSTARMVARVADPHSGRVLTVLSDQPGVQFYSGNFLDGSSVGKSGHVYRQGDAFVIEPQRFPDTPNHVAFGSSRLDPGQTYHSLTIFRFSVDK